MRILHLAAVLVAALGADLITASATGHNLVHRSRHVAKRSSAGGLKHNVTERALERRFDDARFTFYDAGLGACGKVNSRNDFIVALNSAQYSGGAHCFETITIRVGGKTHSAQIVDECPGCPFGGLDFSRGLFDFFAAESVGVLTGSWNFGGSADPAPATHPPPPPPPPKTTTHHAPPPPPPPTHTTEHHDPPTTAAPKPKPTSSPKPEDTTHSAFQTKSLSVSSAAHSSASSTAQSSAAATAPSAAASPSASPSAAAAGNIALMYANMVFMGTMITSGNIAASNST